MSHPLDRPAWNALRSRHRGYAIGDAKAVRYQSDYAMFAAAANRDAESLAALAALVPEFGRVGMMEAEPWPVPPGCIAQLQPPIHQMVAPDITPDTHAVSFAELDDLDGYDMRTLAQLTDPGPFFPRSWRLGQFVGVRENGTLVAMAGERMRLPDFAEVSAVCTHPDHRGRGHAGALMRVVARRIIARGQTPFLHAYAHNQGAIRLYESLGFRFRSGVEFTLLRKPAP